MSHNHQSKAGSGSRRTRTACVLKPCPLLPAHVLPMQEQFLQQIFKHALHCARQFGAEAASAAPSSQAAAASGAAAAAAMKLMTSVLAWDWKASNSSLGFMSPTLAGLTAAMVRAPAATR